MPEPREITLDRGWVIMLRDVGIDAEDVVRRAGLSLGLLSRESTQLSVREYFGLLEATESLAKDPLLALRLGRSASPEAFSPPVFAALCSSTLAVAVRRIGAHKRLMAPMGLTHRETHQGLEVAWEWDDPSIQPPRLLMAMELAFLTQLARIATREPIRPLAVGCPLPLAPVGAFEEFFGVRPTITPRVCLTFHRDDAHRPFLTASEALWQSFEPALRRRVSEMDGRAPMSARTRSTLLECLPGGEASLQGTAKRLGISSRTLQRRLAEEGLSFREVVRATREKLAHHYLVNTPLTYAEVAFLIGFDEPSSFFRAFREWTGTTPESVRRSAR
ncbi:MAG: AraC family transcriptional regulator ligand-binding domain-containing protein [Sandaracinaceae bacterium]